MTTELTKAERRKRVPVETPRSLLTAAEVIGLRAARKDDHGNVIEADRAVRPVPPRAYALVNES
jgi:hypothetical protein